MRAYIKRRGDFRTVMMGSAESWKIPIASAEGDTGQIVLGEYASAEHTGNWLYIMGRIYLISQATPSNNQFTATIADPATGRPSGRAPPPARTARLSKRRWRRIT